MTPKERAAMQQALHDKGLMEGIRAVIAADREKNK